MIELTPLKVTQMILCAIMLFCFGMKFDVSNNLRKIASKIWLVTVIIVNVLAFF